MKVYWQVAKPLEKNFGGALYESHYYSAMGATMPYSAAIP